MVVLLSAVRFCWLTADFPNWSPWMADQAKFTDEGWWSQGAVMYSLLGHWNVPGDYNPAVAAPVWPILLGLVFHFSGISIVAARAVSAAFGVATVGVVYLLVRRFAGAWDKRAAYLAGVVAALLVAASPFAFVFSRLAVLETLVVFEFCLSMLVVSWLAARRIAPMLVLPIAAAVMILTKTTAVTFLPAVAWVAFCADSVGRSWPVRALRAVLAVGVLPALLVEGYAMLAARLGYGADWNYFFDVNAIDEIAWDHAGATLWELARNGMWIDRVLYPLGLAILILSVVWMRRLWRNPLFTASWIALAAQAAFIFRRGEDYAPRYFLLMLVPLVLIVSLAFAELVSLAKTDWPGRRIALVAGGAVGLAIVVSFAINAAMIAGFLRHRSADYYGAAQEIRRIIVSDRKQRPLMLGVSASQLSLMTGIASINDAYGSEDLAVEIRRYQPGWYVVWNGIGDEIKPALAGYELQPVAAYSVFDDDTRNRLMLFRMTPRVAGSAMNR
jgi:hypothetical protein